VVPYLPQSAATVLEVVPIADGRSISLTWPVWVKSPEMRVMLQKSKPDFAISHLLGHEGAGSLRSSLIKRGWINSIGAYVSNDVSDMQLFDVSLDLTEEGFKHRYEAANMVFSYIDLLKKRSLIGPHYIFDELKTLSHVAFDYSEKQDPASYVTTVATNMQSYPLPEYITGPQLYDHPG
jgi:insulysin